MTTVGRKSEHIKITLEEDVEAGKTGFDDVTILHKALPEIDLKKVNIECEFLGRQFSAPFMITGMTGGTEQAEKINKTLAKAADICNIPMGVGSQRVAIENEDVEGTFNVRDVAPNIFLIGNIGAAQFVKGYGIKQARKAVEMINADALAIHLNPLQEASQPEGDTNWEGCLDKIKEICNELDKPVIIKEVGEGIIKEIAVELEKAGASAIDVSGVGGTSWSLIESYRSNLDIGKKFKGWGIPTAASIVEVKEHTNIPVIASGGLRNGIDIAKSLVLGADMAGMALPFLKAAVKGHEEVVNKINEVSREIKTAIFLSGALNIEEFRQKPVIITGKTKDWLELRGIDVKKYARR